MKRMLLSLVLASGILALGWWLFKPEGRAYHVVWIRGDVRAASAFSRDASFSGMVAVPPKEGVTELALILHEGEVVHCRYTGSDGDSTRQCMFRWHQAMGTDLTITGDDKVTYCNGKPVQVVFDGTGSDTPVPNSDWSSINLIWIRGPLSGTDRIVLDEVLNSGAEPGLAISDLDNIYPDTTAAERFRASALMDHAGRDEDSVVFSRYPQRDELTMRTISRYLDSIYTQRIAEGAVQLDPDDQEHYRRFLDPGFDVDSLITKISPVWVYLEGDLRPSTWDLLEHDARLDLAILGYGRVDVQGLLAMQSLRTLCLLDAEAMDSLPWRSDRLWSLSLLDMSAQIIPQLRHLPDLRELHLGVNGPDTLTSLTFLDRFEHLRALSLIGFSPGNDLSPLTRMGHLKYLMLNPVRKVSFERLAFQLNDLEVLALGSAAPDSLVELAFVKDLASLRALSVMDSAADLTPLFGAKDLAFLSVDAERYEADSAGIAELKEALPNTVIVPHSGFCVGSGWLLLAAPILALMAWGAAVRRRSRRSQQVAA